MKEKECTKCRWEVEEKIASDICGPCVQGLSRFEKKTCFNCGLFVTGRCHSLCVDYDEWKPIESMSNVSLEKESLQHKQNMAKILSYVEDGHKCCDSKKELDELKKDFHKLCKLVLELGKKLSKK